MNAIVIEERDGVNAYDVCMRLKDNGLLVSQANQRPMIVYDVVLLSGYVCLLKW